MSEAPALSSAGTSRPEPSVYVCLGGGSALGAYGAGAIAALLERGVEPDVLCGVSVGATVAAIIAGNRREDRLPRLQAYWQSAQSGDLPLPGMPLPLAHGLGGTGSPPSTGGAHSAFASLRAGSNVMHALSSLMLGRPGFFRPRWPGALSLFPFMPPDSGLFDPRPLVRTLPHFIDFDLLQRHSQPRLIVHAVDAGTGESVRFDSRSIPITPEHLVAAASLPPAFPPLRIGQRSLVDAGLVCNVPLDLPLFEATGRRTVYAVDPFCLAGAVPTSLDESAHRAQDIAFSAQTERTLDAMRRERNLARFPPGNGSDRSDSIELLLASYRAPVSATGLKALDFSSRSIEERWHAGHEDMTGLIQMQDSGLPSETGSGYSLYRR